MENNQACEADAIQTYLMEMESINETIEILYKLEGRDLNFNRFKDAIIRLEGILRGFKLSDMHHERMAHQNARNGRRN